MSKHLQSLGLDYWLQEVAVPNSKAPTYAAIAASKPLVDCNLLRLLHHTRILHRCHGQPVLDLHTRTPCHHPSDTPVCLPYLRHVLGSTSTDRLGFHCRSSTHHNATPRCRSH